jgi:hypothetical protein
LSTRYSKVASIEEAYELTTGRSTACLTTLFEVGVVFGINKLIQKAFVLGAYLLGLAELSDSVRKLRLVVHLISLGRVFVGCLANIITRLEKAADLRLARLTCHHIFAVVSLLARIKTLVKSDIAGNIGQWNVPILRRAGNIALHINTSVRASTKALPHIYGADRLGEQAEKRLPPSSHP